MENTIVQMARRLNPSGAVWAIGGSVMLSYHGLIEQPNDIDILAETKDILRIDGIMSSLGIKKEWERDQTYSTEHFYEYTIDGIDVDVMAGFQIHTPAGLYRYLFDERSVAGTRMVQGEPIPLAAMEDWYILYQLMPHRESKVRLIEAYLLENGIRNRFLLERAIRGTIPGSVRNRSEELLRKLT